MTGSAREVIAQEIYNSLEHIDMNDARLGAHDMLVALTRAGFAIVPVEPTEAMLKPAADILAGEPADEPSRNMCEEIWRSMLSAARQQEAQDDD